MKKLLFLLLTVISLQSFGQIKITDMTTLTLDPVNGWVPIVKGGVNYKVDAINIGRDSVGVSTGPSADTLKWYRYGVFSFYKLITRGTVISVGTGWGLSGGTITASGTVLVDSATLSGYFLRRKDSASASNPTGYITKKDLDDSLMNYLRTSQALVVDTTGALNNYEAYIKRTAGQPDTLKFRAATGSGSDSTWYLRFQPGITVNAPAVGDSIFKHSKLAGKYKKIYREGKLLNYDDSLGYEYRGYDTSIVFHGPLATNERIYVELTDSLPTRELALETPPTSSLLLDLYSSSLGAYSLFKLRTAYSGHAIKVRRSSDNATQDIDYLSSGYLDTASMKTFVSTGTGYVDTWYDQSGNAYDLTQSTTGNQPVIIESGGTVYRSGGDVAIKFTSGSSHYLTNTSIALSSAADAYIAYVFKSNSAGSNYIPFGMGSNSFAYQHGAASNRIYAYAGNLYGDFPNSSTSLHLSETIFDGGGAANADRLKYYLNTSAQTASSFSGSIGSTVSGTGLSIGRLYAVGVYFDGAASTFVIWANDKSADRTGIEAKINALHNAF